MCTQTRHSASHLLCQETVEALTLLVNEAHQLRLLTADVLKLGLLPRSLKTHTHTPTHTHTHTGARARMPLSLVVNGCLA